jgi:hypothetical protein
LKGECRRDDRVEGSGHGVRLARAGG